MTNFTKTFLAAPFMVAALSFGATAPASAQTIIEGPIVGGGLITINVSDIDLGIIANVQVPISVAAQVCGVAVNVLATAEGDVECPSEITAESVAENRQFMRFADRQGQGDAIRGAAGLL